MVEGWLSPTTEALTLRLAQVAPGLQLSSADCNSCARCLAVHSRPEDAGPGS